MKDTQDQTMQHINRLGY